jgi:hypothetical protein
MIGPTAAAIVAGDPMIVVVGLLSGVPSGLFAPVAVAGPCSHARRRLATRMRGSIGVSYCMAQYRVICEDCEFERTVDDADPPATVRQWDAHNAALGVRDDHQQQTDHSAAVEQIE